MNIKQIKYFVSVFDHGSLSAAAKDQYVTVQAVSKAIADLERELKSDLFIRQSRGVRPTLFGKSFYAKAEPVLRMFADLEEFACSYQESGSLTLKLALCTPPFSNHERARASISSFVGKNLGIETTVALEGCAQGVERLRAGVYDALLTVGALAHPDLDCVSVGTISTGVLMATSHPLASRTAVSLEDLEPFPMAVASGFESFGDPIREKLRERGVDVRQLDFDRKNLDEFLGADGAVFVIGIPALGRLHPQSVTRLVASEDAVAIPICLVSPKERKSHAYCVFERWIVDELLVLGGNSIGRLAVAAVGSPAK
ncbi:LysR family transcriptional regulator [Arabiibacter massiliensis]|uniref:LysR family transcriptional regulator n=1 Tax=Arabiibacter massiliensis TaxID=1870985 RepID=UPI0009BAC586|nr:LysR family transcriptional regulator [Arabiibacter massiliensis]